MVGWHHRLNGHGSEQTPEDGEGYSVAWHTSGHGLAKSQTQLSS